MFSEWQRPKKLPRVLHTSLQIFVTAMAHLCSLRLEDEVGADLVRGLVELLGIERGTEAKSEARVDLGVVRDSGDTAVVDLALLYTVRSAPPCEKHWSKHEP